MVLKQVFIFLFSVLAVSGSAEAQSLESLLNSGEFSTIQKMIESDKEAFRKNRRDRRKNLLSEIIGAPVKNQDQEVSQKALLTFLLQEPGQSPETILGGLNTAIAYKNLALISLILETPKGLSAKSLQKFGSISDPLFNALAYPPVFDFLIHHSIGFDINFRGSSMIKPSILLEAVKVNQAEVVKLILNHKDFDPDRHFDGVGRSALAHAALRDQLEIFKVLVKDSRFSVAARDQFGGTLLEIPSQRVLEFILKNIEIDPGDHISFSGRTPLHRAASRGDLDAFKLFVENSKFDINRLDDRGEGVLTKAFISRHMELIKFILNHRNFRLSPIEETELNPLHVAIRENAPDVLDLLLKSKLFDIGALDDWGYSIFFKGLIDGRAEIVRVLFRNGISDFSEKSSDGLTPIEIAIDRGRLEGLHAFFSLLEDSPARLAELKTIAQPAIHEAIQRVKGAPHFLLSRDLSKLVVLEDLLERAGGGEDQDESLTTWGSGFRK